MTTAAVPLQWQQARKAFGPTKALDGVSLKVLPGVTAVLGQNGAGKTTLIRSALGLLSLDEGAVTLFGRPCAQRAARERVGVMLQDSDLPDLLTASELIELFASYYPSPLAVTRTLELADIEGFANKRYKHLSGGQKRRVQFALAIVGNPDLVFLDEPTTGLDTDARRALWSVVRAFAGEGKSIVLTTHYLEEADTLADRIVILRDGRVVASAPAEEIRAQFSGSTIRCLTSLDDTALVALAHVVRVGQSGKYRDIQTSDVVATLRELLAADSALTDLSVSRPGLEDLLTGDFV